MLICVHSFLYNSRLPVLPENLVRARPRIPENKVSVRGSMLHVWAIAYLWGQATAPEDVFDGIKDDEVKAWFNKTTKKLNGGIDRATFGKRAESVKSTKPPTG